MIAESFSVDGPAELDISAPAGSIIVEAGPPGRADVTIDTSRPEDWRISQTGDAITIGYERGGWVGGGRVVIRATVPHDSNLRVRSASADVRVSAPLRRATVSTASGDIRTGPAESVAVKTASGEVTLGAVAKDAAVKSASGDIHVAAVEGSTSISTASGDIVVDTASGPFKANSASGDVRVALYLGADFEANTMSGDIAVGLPAGRTVKLRAATLSGKVTIPEKQDGAPSSNPTGVSINAKSVSGDIRLSRIE